MKSLNPSDELRTQYLVLCDQLLGHIQSMRNYAMKPGNAWLARAELSKITNLTGDIEDLIDRIKETDQAG